MADLPISGLPAATPPLTGAELLPVVQGGVTDRCTSTQLINTAAPITNINVTGGNINGTTIGATTPAQGHFSVMFTPDANITGGTIDGTTIGKTTPEAAVFTSDLTSQAGTSTSFYPLMKNLGFDATVTSVTTSPAIVAAYSFPANFFTTGGQYLTYDVYLKASSSAATDSFTIVTTFTIGVSSVLSVTSLIPITVSTSPQIVRLNLKAIFIPGNFLNFDFNAYSAASPGIGSPSYIQDIAGSVSFAPSNTCGVQVAISGSATCTVQYIHSSVVGT